MAVIVGLAGRKRSGKGTFARVLVEKYGFTELAFADALRKLVGEAFGLSQDAFGDEHKERVLGLLDLGPKFQEHTHVTPRWLLQKIGVGARDVLGDDIWVRALFRNISTNDSRYVISDVRFENEYEAIRDPRRSLAYWTPLIDRSYVVRLNRLPLVQEHAYFPPDPERGGDCLYCYVDDEARKKNIATNVYGRCRLPEEVHPTAFPHDKHPSENSLPLRSNEDITYDAVFDCASPEEVEEHARAFARSLGL